MCAFFSCLCKRFGLEESTRTWCFSENKSLGTLRRSIFLNFSTVFRWIGKTEQKKSTFHLNNGMVCLTFFLYNVHILQYFTRLWFLRTFTRECNFGTRAVLRFTLYVRYLIPTQRVTAARLPVPINRINWTLWWSFKFLRFCSAPRSFEFSTHNMQISRGNNYYYNFWFCCFLENCSQIRVKQCEESVYSFERNWLK